MDKELENYAILVVYDVMKIASVKPSKHEYRFHVKIDVRRRYRQETKDSYDLPSLHTSLGVLTN